jgi:hypothetical protein
VLGIRIWLAAALWLSKEGRYGHFFTCLISLVSRLRGMKGRCVNVGCFGNGLHICC